MAEQSRTHRRAATLAVAALVAAVAAFLVPVEVSSGSLALGESCAEAAPAQATVNIGMVVDFGDLKGAGDPDRIRATCVGVPAGTVGFAMLELAGHAIRLNSSGLLCAIDGLPEVGCGERTAAGYRYWAYFHGTGSSWSYSSIGPGGYRAAEGTVEGWHFVEGAGNPSDPPPGRAPTNICPAAPPPTVAPTTAPPPLPTARPSVPTPAPAPTSPGGAADPAGSSAGATPGAPTTSSNVPSDASADGATGSTDEGAGPSGDDAPPGTGTDGEVASSPGTTTVGADGVASDVTVLAAAQDPSAASDRGAPVATLLVVVAVAALGGAAARRFRGRSDSSS